MLRLESNARAIDHNVITQSSTNNGGMDFHQFIMPVWRSKSKLLTRYLAQSGKLGGEGSRSLASR